MNRIRIGVLAAGNIAAAYASSASEFAHADVVAIGSRTQEKADRFAARFGIPKAYGSYEALVGDPEIDALYLASPNHAHKEWAIRAAQAGKHVLCEKPLALSVADVEEMFQVAEDYGVVLIEAFPFRFQPQTIAVLDQVASGAIGEVVACSACFGFRMRDPDNIRLVPEMGGGAVWDVGCYAINLCNAVYGSAPIGVTASAKWSPEGVDVTTSALLEYGRGKSATIWCSFETATFRRANIIGTETAIDFSYTNHAADAEAAAYFVQSGAERGQERKRVDTQPGHGYVLETDAFCRLISGSSDPFYGTTKRQTIQNTAICIAVLESALTGRPADLQALL